MQQDKASGNSIAALVLGILAFVGCGVFTAIPAWIVGSGEVKKIDAGQSPAAGRTFAQIGMILGIVGTVLGVIGLIWLFAMGGLALLTAGGASRPH
jgi:heme/copper-type cytochrome/quinol oxidase subunit 4